MYADEANDPSASEAENGQRHRSPSSWVEPLIGLAVVLVLLVLPSWPGRINADISAMLQGIDDGAITNWHAPLLQFAWTPFHKLGVGIGPIFLGQTVLAFIAFWLICESLQLSRRGCTVVAAVLCLNPIGYGFLTSVIRDTWFAVFWLLALASVRTPRVSGYRRLAVVASFCFLAFAARQNGIVIAPALLFIALGDTPGGRGMAAVPWKRAVVAVLLTGLLIGVNSSLQRVLPIEQRRPGAVYMWDLVRFSLRSDQMLLPDELNPQQIGIDELHESASPYVLDQLIFVDFYVPYELDQNEAEAAFDAWLDVVEDDPIEYYRMRWQLMSRQIGLSGNTRHPFLPEAIENPYGIGPRFPALADRATDYQLSFNQGSVWWQAGAIHRTWLYFVVGMIAAGLAVLKRRGGPVCVDVAATAFPVLASIMFFAPQLQYRFVGTSAWVCLISAVALFGRWRSTPTPTGTWALRSERAEMQSGQRLRDQTVQQELTSEQNGEHSRVGDVVVDDDLADSDAYTDER